MAKVQAFEQHVVGVGESLEDFAERTGASVEELLRHNGTALANAAQVRGFGSHVITRESVDENGQTTREQVPHVFAGETLQVPKKDEQGNPVYEEPAAGAPPDPRDEAIARLQQQLAETQNKVTELEGAQTSSDTPA